ncbi:subclass B1 metallo-beta-lactamase [Chryseobacterium pennipullorum]|uniref:beta-lactamase n=1 Tax=Chryseobacterium pennipullorum TaxID=2258963 RepID=A0A3D9B6X1_9FLAO|nr:subclass B1 metallo-beta-lactamase [Chryseobacterium pennipullorum]REC49374.1 subclass B1 metallo-beta-lactamase [Chryseobacterium pennipullorum]
MRYLFFILFSLTVVSCSSQKKDTFKAKEIYKSDHLIITQISEHSFIHTSYKQTNDFGNVPCNGLVVKDHNETIVFDTPVTDESSEELIRWINGNLHSKINAVVATHFHDDSMGGIQAFNGHKIPSYGYIRTLELGKQDNFAVPVNSFVDSLVLKVGDEKALVGFFGEGHTKDNTVGYFPKDQILFGGCLLKELEAGKGYLGDANVSSWPDTVEKVKKKYPDVKIVVPGHGEYGDRKLLDYTINLFKK